MLSGSVLGPNNINSLRKYVAVVLLTKEILTLPAEGKTKICELEAQVTSYLERMNMQQVEIFGLAVQNEGEFIFAIGENKLSKYANRQWKQSSNGLDQSGNPLLRFEWRVRCYIHSQLVIKDSLSRLHYYLQLRENILRFGHHLREESAILLASLALQADFGDFNHDRHQGQYFNPSNYLPSWVVEQNGISCLLESLASNHRKNRGIPTSEAQAQFIREASHSDAPHNIHLFHLKRKKHDPSSQVALTICDKGIDIYEEDIGRGSSTRTLVQAFLWSNIADLSFEKKKFEIRANNFPGKLTFYTSSDERSKHLLHLCRLTHQFSRNQRPTFTDIRQPTQDQKQHRDSCYLSHNFMLPETDNFSGLAIIGNDGNQRISICSNSSSNRGTSDNLSNNGNSNLSRDSPYTQSVNRSLSMSSSTKTDSSDLDFKQSGRYTPTSQIDDSGNWAIASVKADSKSSPIGRAESNHSISSQNSSSTIRSRYSFVHSHQRPEFTLGAELADLSLAPELPELADLPGMAADLEARGEDVPDSVSHIHTTHNCCSTCCDDVASIGSEDELDENELIGGESTVSCNCGICTNCINEGSKGLCERNILYNFNGAHNLTKELYQHDNGYGNEDQSIVALSEYSSPEHFPGNFNGLNVGEKYVDYCKRNFSDSLQTKMHHERSEIEKHILRASSQANSSIQEKYSRGKNSSPENHEQALDYSVESAQASISSTYPLSKNLLSWAMRPENEYRQENSNEGIYPEAVPMSTVTTVHPINVVSSKFHNNSTGIQDIGTKSLPIQSVIAIDSDNVSTTKSTEAKAKFITSKPRITILKAHTQLAATTLPSFSSVASRQKTASLPQIPGNPKICAIQSLQRITSPHSHSLTPSEEVGLQHSSSIPKLSQNPIPVIRKNNYLDIHASSYLSKEMMKAHPEQVSSKNPRSLFLRNQKKKLQRQVVQSQHQIEQFRQQMLNETVHQPAAYAQGVGVPLLPPPTLSGCCHRNNQQCRQCCINSQPCVQTKSQSIRSMHKSCSSCHCQSSQIHYSPENVISSHQNMLYQSQIKNFFQNPPPPAPHPGYGIGACPVNHLSNISSEGFSPTYQCASDPGTYPSIVQGGSIHQKQPVLATVYANQVNLSQIEQFKAQLNSDTDYVIYPHKDPAISRQEYMDAKQGQVIATQAQKQLEQQYQTNASMENGNSSYVQLPPPYRSPKSSPLYRSTPNVAVPLGQNTGPLSSYPSYQSLASHGSTHKPGSSSGYSSMARGRYFSQQSLASSFSSVPSGYSASTQSLSGSYDPLNVEQSSVPSSPPAVMRVRSDESILSAPGLNENEICTSNSQRLPPPPYRAKEAAGKLGTSFAKSSRNNKRTRSRSRPRVTLQQVRECSSQLDVPLIAALFSDSSLLSESGDGPENKPAYPSSASSVISYTTTKSASPDKSPLDEKNLSAKSPVAKMYTLDGVYTTNQVPAPRLNSKASKSGNGAHQHPKRSAKSSSTPAITEINEKSQNKKNNILLSS